VHAWRVHRDPKTDFLVHAVPAGSGHAVLAPLTTYLFKALRVSAAVWEHERDWFPIHNEPNVFEFELEHGVEKKREAYNTRSFAQVFEHKRAVRGEHAGFADLFAPIFLRGKVVAILVAGPFARGRPTSAAVFERWRWLTGRQGHPSDPEFARYVSATLSTLVLDGDKVRTFERVVGCLTLLMSGEGKADAIVNEWEAARVELEKVRQVERAWDAVREMVDERSSNTWNSATRTYALSKLGLSSVPDSVLVGLAVSRRTGRDAVDEAIRRDAFQRAAVHMAERAGDTIAGQVGDHGVAFLLAATGSAQKKRARLRDLAERATKLAEHDFGLALHCGSAEATRSSPLDRTYQAALGAAESALVRGAPLFAAEAVTDVSAGSLRHLRRELGRGVEERPGDVSARFDRYAEAVAAHCGYRMEPIRAHLDVGFERIAQPLVDSGAIDEKSLVVMQDGLDRAAKVARTTEDLLAAYRVAVADLSKAAGSPVEARHDRSLRRAVEHIHAHYTEPVRLATLARISGISPSYFSELFRQREGMTFEQYLAGLRIERAKQLLSTTDLGVARVARLSGFSSSAYFCRAFRRAEGAPPLAYRKAAK
jgi:AraC-like DNA-binding protein